MAQMKSRKVLIHTLVFPPDGVSTAYLYGDIATALRERGFDVTVLTTTPHYNRVPSQLVAQPMRWLVPGFLKVSRFRGIRVLHVPQKKFTSTLLRLFGFVYWHIVSFVTALTVRGVDVIISPSPPLTIGLLNLWLGKLKGAKIVYNVQEVYPDILGKKSGLVYNILSRMEHCIYRNSDAVTTIDNVFRDTIVGRFEEPQRLHVIPNFVDTDIYRPLDAWPDLDPELFVDNGHLRLLYAGNIGMAQDWETLVELARRTKGKAIDYYVIGEGMKREWLSGRIKELSLSNVRLLPYQPRGLMPQIIAFSDLQFIFMESRIAAQGFPSKVYTIMASGKPLLVCSPQGTPIVNFLEGVGCAKLICADKPEDKASEAEAWLTSVSPQELREMGRKGLDVIKKGYTKDIVTDRYARLLQSL